MPPLTFELKVDFTLLLSILSFIWAGVTFYLTFLRRGKLAIAPPRLFGLSTIEGNHGKRGNLVIALPLTLVNIGAKLITVEDMRLDLGNNRPLLLWQTELDNIPPTKKSSLASQFAVPGYNSVSRICGFVCDDPEFRIVEGRYTVQVQVLTGLKWKTINSFGMVLKSDELPGIEAGGIIIKLGVLKLLP
jgi:hypothetical protein